MASVAGAIGIVIVAGRAVTAARRRQAQQPSVREEPDLVERERERVNASG